MAHYVGKEPSFSPQLRFTYENSNYVFYTLNNSIDEDMQGTDIYCVEPYAKGGVPGYIYKGSLFTHAVKTYMSTGDILVEFANYDIHKLENLLKSIESELPNNNLHHLMEQLYKSATKDISIPLAHLIILHIIDSARVGADFKMDEFMKYDSCKKLSRIRRMHQNIIDFLNNQQNDLSIRETDLSVMPYLKEGNASLIYYFMWNPLEAFLSFDIVQSVSKDLIFIKCANCGKHFIQNSKLEKYCNFVFARDKTCREIGYEKSMGKINPFQKEYRKALNRHNSRRDFHVKNDLDKGKEYISAKYNPWNNASVEAREYFKGTNNLEGYKAWLLKNDRDKSNIKFEPPK